MNPLEPTPQLVLQEDARFVDHFVASIEEQRHSSAREPWIREQMISQWMQSAQRHARWLVLALVLVACILYAHLPVTGVLLWVAIAGMFLFAQYWAARRFDVLRQIAIARSRVLNIELFLRRFAPIWVASALVWVFPVGWIGLSFSQELLYLMLLTIIVLGMLSAVMLAAWLKLFEAYVHLLMGATLVALIWHFQKTGWTNLSAKQWILMGSGTLCWLALLKMGRIFHQMSLTQWQASFDNEILIHSLRLQTQSAVEAVQIKNKLLATAAHDLRQPVHALSFYADWLRSDPNQAVELLPKVIKATEAVNTLFNSLFDFARIEAGAMPINIQQVQLRALLEEQIAEHLPTARAKQLSLRLRALDRSVRSDPLQLRRIVSNLLSNALRYTDQGGVLLALRQREKRLVLEVWDTGLGIPTEQQSLIFQEFHRAHVGHGTVDSLGLGLAIVQKLSQTLGHRITLSSVPGRGSCFRLWL